MESEKNKQLIDIMSHQPAKHPDSNFLDKQSIGLINHILASHKRVISDLKEIDKWPNIDGYLEFQASNFKFVGKLEAQVKTLPMNHKLKFNCDIRLLTYCQIASLPVIFLAVDNKNQKIFWLHLSNEFINSINFKQNRSTKVIYLKENQVITKNNRSYINDWERIVKDHLDKIQQFNSLKKDYQFLVNHSNSILNEKSDYYKYIRRFLDQYNYFLDRKLTIIKDILYPSTWKLGFAFTVFNENEVSYTLYPIPKDVNDIQIKKLDNYTFQHANRLVRNLFIGHIQENPIINRPKEYARDLIKTRVMELTNNKSLIHNNIEFLDKEITFTLVDKLFKSSRSENRNCYPIPEIEKVIDKVVANQHIISYRFSPVGIIKKYIESLKENNITEVCSIYEIKDYSRMKTRSSWIWNWYSPVAVKNNLTVFFDNIIHVYHEFVSKNFPEIKNQLPLFYNASKVILIYEVKDDYEEYSDGPIITYLFLKNDSDEKLNFVLLSSEEARTKLILDEIRVEEEIVFDGVKYILTNLIGSTLDFIFNDFPMLEYIYNIVEENINEIL